MKAEDDGHTFLFVVDDDLCIDAGVGGNAARFINHKCDANCETVIEGRRVFIEATRTIEPGEELGYDYQLTWESTRRPGRARSSTPAAAARPTAAARCSTASRSTRRRKRSRRRRKPAAGEPGRPRRRKSARAAAEPRMPLVSLVVATDERGAIGRDGGLPWHLPDDLRRFKALTLGKPVVMGRKTWDSIGRPLPGRHNLVITRQAGLDLPGATVVASLEEALAAAGDVPEVCVIGGAEIFRQALPRSTWCT